MMVTKAEKSLTRLETELTRVEARITELETQRESGDGDLVALSGELAELRSTRLVLGDRLGRARQDIAEERKRANAPKIRKERETEARLWQEAQRIAFGPLEDTLRALVECQRRLRDLGAGPALGDTVIFDAVQTMHQFAAYRGECDWSGYPWSW